MPKHWGAKETEKAQALFAREQDYHQVADLLNAEFDNDRSPKAVKTKLAYLARGAKVDFSKLAKEMFNQADERASVIKLPEREAVFKGRRKEDAVLLLSDMHIGKVNWFVDLDTDEPYQTYNEEIMLEEVNTLLDGVATYNEILSGGYDIRKLHIWAVGDLLDNDQIQKGQQFFIDNGVGAQLMLGVRVLARMIRELLHFYQEIALELVPGNHGRMTPKPTRAPTSNNFDWLLGAILEREFQHEERVSVHPSNSWFRYLTVHGWKYLLHHGNAVYSWMGMPYYGLTRRGTQRRTELPIDLETIGHFHTQFTIPINAYSKTLVNGSWIEKDDFSWHKYATLSWPQQTYFGLSPKRPITWLTDLDLKKKDENVARQWRNWARLHIHETDQAG